MERSHNADSMKPKTVDEFQNLWTKICSTYKGTNVGQTIACLLHMYEPEAGLLVYEKLLRTIHFLLENYESNAVCRLLSMISAPKNVLNSVIEKTFFDATGFRKFDMPTFTFRSNMFHRVSPRMESSIALEVIKKKNSTSLDTPQVSSPDNSYLPPKKRKITMDLDFQPKVELSKPQNSKNNVQVPYSLLNVKHNPDCCQQHSIIKNCKLIRNRILTPSFAQKSAVHHNFPGKSSDKKYVMIPLSQIRRNSSIYGFRFQNDQENLGQSMALNLEVSKNKGNNFENRKNSKRMDETEIQRNIHVIDHVQNDDIEKTVPKKQGVKLVDFLVGNRLEQSLRNFISRIERNEKCRNVVKSKKPEEAEIIQTKNHVTNAENQCSTVENDCIIIEPTDKKQDQDTLKCQETWKNHEALYDHSGYSQKQRFLQKQHLISRRLKSSNLPLSRVFLD